MEPDDALGDDEPHSPLLPPDDRLWRHPSEVAVHGLPWEEHPPPRGPPPVWAVACLAALAGALLTVGAVAATGGLRGRVHTVPAVERVALQAGMLGSVAAGAGQPAEVAQVAARLRPAMVRLEVQRDGADGAGGAVLFRSDGYLLTSHQVVRDAGRITAVTDDGRRAPARVVGADPATDIAVLKVEGWSGVATMPLGSAASLRPGQHLMTVHGNKAVVFQVRSLGRRLERPGAPALMDMIETDRPFAAGSSGAALVDGAGAVVGVATASGRNGSQEAGGGFATPIDWARSVAEQLLGTGKVVPVWMGVEGADLDAATAGRLGLAGGAVITGVRSSSPAGRAGLAPDDVITSVDGVPVASMSALRLLMRSHRPGQVVALALVRGGRARTVNVTLTERRPA